MIRERLTGTSRHMMAALIHHAETRKPLSPEMWLMARRSGIGGSDAPVVLNVSPWKAAITLWGEKTGRLPEPVLDSDAVEMGKALEPVILSRYATKSGRETKGWPSTLIVQSDNVATPWLMCTPDGLTFDPDLGVGLIQAKTTGERMANQWDADPPLYHQVQLQHEMAATGATWGSLVVLIGCRSLRWFDFRRADDFIARMIAIEATFWEAVTTNVQPAIDEWQSRAGNVSRTLAALYGDDNGDRVLLDDTAIEWDRRLEELKERMAELEQEAESLKTLIKDRIGSASVGMLSNGVCYSWKTVARKAYSVAASESRVLKRVSVKGGK